MSELGEEVGRRKETRTRRPDVAHQIIDTGMMTMRYLALGTDSR